MKNSNKESSRSRLVDNSKRASENERNQNSEEERPERGEDSRERSGTEGRVNEALSQGYFPDGPGGNYTGA